MLSIEVVFTTSFCLWKGRYSCIAYGCCCLHCFETNWYKWVPHILHILDYIRLCSSFLSTSSTHGNRFCSNPLTVFSMLLGGGCSAGFYLLNRSGFTISVCLERADACSCMAFRCWCLHWTIAWVEVEVVILSKYYLYIQGWYPYVFWSFCLQGSRFVFMNEGDADACTGLRPCLIHMSFSCVALGCVRLR